MSTSTLGGLVLGLPASAVASELPMRTSTMQDVANNWNHVADQRSRVLVSYAQRSTTTGGRAVGLKTIEVGLWTRAYSFGPFPLLIGPTGIPYPIRARVGGRAGVVTDTCILRIGVCPLGQATAMMSDTTIGASVIETASFTDVTNSWRAPSVADQLLVPDAATFVEAPLGIVNAVSSGTPGTIDAIMATIEVWGQCSTTNGVYCSQAYAAEYVGIV